MRHRGTPYNSKTLFFIQPDLLWMDSKVLVPGILLLVLKRLDWDVNRHVFFACRKMGAPAQESVMGKNHLALKWIQVPEKASGNFKL